MAEARSAEVCARYILQIFKRHRCMTGGTLLAFNLTLPFSQDGWNVGELAEGQKYAIEQGWITPGKEDKFFKLTEAGFAQIVDLVAEK